MTRNQVRAFVHGSSLERLREVLDLFQSLKLHRPVPESERNFLLDLRDHEAFFKQLADEKLQGR